MKDDMTQQEATDLENDSREEMERERLCAVSGSACPVCGDPSCLGNECVQPLDEVDEPARTRTCNKCKHCGRKGDYIRCDHPDVKGMEEADGIAEDFAEECETYEPNHE